jgi:DNA repair protein RadA/Sms
MKQRIKYVCSNCGYEALKWLGKCPSCEEWQTFTEEIIEEKKYTRGVAKKAEVYDLNDVSENEDERIKTDITELDRVLGGGFVPGSVVLIGGDPGIGKSTLIMQAVAKINSKVVYVSGEESLKQLSLRAKRLKINVNGFYVITETDFSSIKELLKETSPSVVVIDSIQTIYKPDFDNAPGTVTQIRECTSEIMQYAKSTNTVFIIIGHITKEGYIAGPKILEHIVDTVIQFEGERNHSYRILRAQKNRFGSTNELGIFEMHDTGLSEVKNPSEIFIGERKGEIPGSVITASIEGTRPILLEVQALVTPSNYGNPQRVGTGFDYRRLSILLAVLEKRAGIRLSAQNVFLNMAGGIRIDEPAVDLAVCAAITSSALEKSTQGDAVVIGEVGLGGEIRSVGHIEKRIQEAIKLGFKKIILPKNNFKNIKRESDIKIVQVSDIKTALDEILIR